MKKVIVPVIMLLMALSIQAQQVKGKVFMQNDSTPAQFASVGLIQLPDSTIISGVITLTDGGYTFESVKPGEYLVKVSFMGYEPIEKPVSLTQGSNLNVDNIYLTESTTNVGEVTIVGERLKGKELVDRTSYSIPPLVAKSSTNGYELLKKIPQVQVDFQNNVTLNGSANFIIEVDGRQRDKEFLAKLLPTDIETIEIISNPSGRYEGNIDGVISIILKKEARYGVNGNLGLQIKPFNKLTYALTGSVDYAMGKITFYATAYTGGQNLNILSKTRYDFKNVDSLSSTYGKGTINVGFSSVNTGFDYYINDRNNMSFNINYRPIKQDIDIQSEATILKNNNPENSISTLTNNLTKSDEMTVSLFHKKTFKKPVQEVTAEVSYYIFKSNDANDFINTRKVYNTDLILDRYSRLEDNLNERNYLSAKLNYVHPFGMKTRFETGYQVYYQQLNYDFMFEQQINSDLLSGEENFFKYREMRNSAYAGFTINLKKIGFQTMLRLENTHINADSVTSPDYTVLLPSLNLQYKFSASHNLKFTYNRRINRPGIYDMNPNWRVGQNYEISQGNPNLRPDYRDHLQLTYTWNFGSNYFSPNIYYEALSDKIGTRYDSTFSQIDNSLTTFSKPFNLLSGYEIGGGLTAMLWFVNINARIFKGHFNEYTDQSFNIPATDYFSYSITSYAFAPLDKAKKTTAFAFLMYNGVNVSAQTKTYSLPFYGFGAQKEIKSHNIGFVWLLPLSKDVNLSRTETSTPVYNIENIIGFDVSWFIQFMYSYKFNKGKSVKKIGHNVEIESDSKKQGIGM
jgi:outer membrane receptor protein involved in Fe transport